MTFVEATVPLWTLLRSREEFGGRSLTLLTVKSESGVHVRDLADGRQPSDDMSGYRVVRQDDLIVNKLWARFGAYGVSPSDGVISPAYWVLKINAARVVPMYLHYLLRSSPYLAEISRLSKNLPPNGYDLPWMQFSRIQVALPSLRQQWHIVKFLDVELGWHRRIGEVREAQIRLLSERSDAVVSEVLIPRASGVGGSSRMWAWMPTDMPLTRLGYICRLQSGVTVDAKREALDDSVTRPYLRVANVQAGYLDLKNVAKITLPKSVAAGSLLRSGDVLMTEGGDLDKLGRGAVWMGEVPDCLHQNHVFALRPEPTKLDPHYLAYMTQTSHGRAYFESTGVRTTNLASTNSAKILGFPIPLTSVCRQRQLVSVVRAELASIERLHGVLASQRELLTERRQALITAAVTGQIDVSTARGVSA